MSFAANTYALETHDLTQLNLYAWLPADAQRDSKPLHAVILLIHGMAEHAGRYADFAQTCMAQNVALYAPDLRGHGQTPALNTKGNNPEESSAVMGHFSFAPPAKDGWNAVLDDIAAVYLHIRKTQGDVPVILMGHSMGSYIAQAFLMKHTPQYGYDFAGVVLSGSNATSVMMLKIAQTIAKAERLREGALGRSPLLNTLSFGKFNNAFKPAHTAFDWLSRDAAQVDAYVNDPQCGFLCTNQFWVDLLGGLVTINTRKNREKLVKQHKNLPMYIMGGENDPVSKGGGLEKLRDAYQNAGFEQKEAIQVGLRIYADGRHEMLNETNRAEVMADILAWCFKLTAIDRRAKPAGAGWLAGLPPLPKD